MSAVPKHGRPYVYVDMGQVISHITQAVVTEKPANTQERIDAYRTQFRSLAHKYAQENGVIVFSSPKPVSGAKDATGWFIEHLHVKYPEVAHNGKHP